MSTISHAESQERSLKPMIAKMSYDTFNKLPYSERLGLSVEDLISDAKIVIFTRAAKKYNPMMHVKFSTFAFKILENHFKSILRDAYTAKRSAVLLSLDYQYRTNSGNIQTLYDRMARSKIHCIENRLILRIDAERAFIKAYSLASTKLRKYMIAWILQPKASSKIDKLGIDASLAKREFKAEAMKYLTPEICDFIQKDYECRTTIANKLSTRFFTPRNSTCMGYANFTSRRTVEHALLPILSPDRRASIVALVD